LRTAIIAVESAATRRKSASTPGSNRSASCKALRSTDGESWTWIQVSSMPSPPESSGPTASRSPALSRRTWNAGFMIAA
jgi:hypothetical protein